MELQLLRNATLRLRYAGVTILVDPCLGEKGSLPSFAGITTNPMVDLPASVSTAIADVDLVVVSHLHPDHFDPTAAAVLPKSLPLLCQPADVGSIKKQGFAEVHGLDRAFRFGEVTISPTNGQHGNGAILEKMGQVIGLVLRSAQEPSLYWVGDSVLTQGVLRTIDIEHPDLIITHSGGATLNNTLLLMDDEQTVQLCDHASGAIVIAVHLEALDHCTVSRHQLRDAAERHGISARRFLIPSDGESLAFHCDDRA